MDVYVLCFVYTIGYYCSHCSGKIHKIKFKMKRKWLWTFINCIVLVLYFVHFIFLKKWYTIENFRAIQFISKCSMVYISILFLFSKIWLNLSTLHAVYIIDTTIFVSLQFCQIWTVIYITFCLQNEHHDYPMFTTKEHNDQQYTDTHMLQSARVKFKNKIYKIVQLLNWIRMTNGDLIG